MRIKAEETMAIVIDYQEKLIPAINENEKVVHNTEILINGLKEFDIPIIVSQQYTKGLGETVDKIAQAVGDFTAFDKKAFSLCLDNEIYSAIRKTGKKNIILCGVEAHICVLQTAIDLLEKEYNVFFVEDCVGSRKDNDKQMALHRAEEEGAFITTYEAVLYELTKSAADEHFKAVSKLTK